MAIPVWRHTMDGDDGSGEGKDGTHNTGSQLFVASGVLFIIAGSPAELIPV